MMAKSAHTKSRVGRFIVSVLTATGLALLSSQTISAGEYGLPKLEGVWANPLLIADDPRWRIVDIACARTGCSVIGFEYLQGLLDDAANNDRSMRELFADMREYEKEQNKNLLTPLGLKKQAEYSPSEGAALDCTPEGDSLRHQILAPVPMEFEQLEDRVIISYEYWNAVRTVYLDGRMPPEDAPATRLGHSTGRYEGSTFVVETTNIIPNVSGVPGGGAFAPGEDATFVERYSLIAENGRLDLELNIIDSEHFLKPYGNQRSYLPAPDWELDEFVCEAITGEF